MRNDKHNLYLVALLYGKCDTSPVGCPPELLAAMNSSGKTQVSVPSVARCPAPKVTPGKITGVASKTVPNYALVTGQDPEKRGVDLQFTLTIAPTVLEYYTLEKTSSKLCISPSGSIVDTPPLVEKNCLPPNRYEEKETEECVQHTRTFCEQARGILATASLKQSSRDWITGELAEWYTGAHLIQPDWLWKKDQGQGGCDGSNTYRWTLTLPKVQVRDLGFYGMSEFEDPRKARALRAMMGLVNQQLRVIPLAGKLWTVESSMSGKPREYTVAHGVVPGFTCACTCPDWQKHHEDCKHILAMRLLVEQQV